MLKNSKFVLFLSPKKLVRPETFGPYYVYGMKENANIFSFRKEIAQEYPPCFVFLEILKGV